MKLFRVALVCTLFLVAALPTFAAPVCEDCVDGRCGPDSSFHMPCRSTASGCVNYTTICYGFATAEMGLMAEWKVASIEITNELTKVVVAPSAIAQVAPATIAQAGAPQPAAQK